MSTAYLHNIVVNVSIFYTTRKYSLKRYYIIIFIRARAIAGLKDCKAPGGDGIPVHGGDNLFSRLH